MKTTIAFPGLGIEQFELNRAAFTIPIGDGITVYWYGIIIAIGIVLAFSYFLWRAKKFEHIREDDCYNIALFTVPIAIIGARTLYVITNLDQYIADAEEFIKLGADRLGTSRIVKIVKNEESKSAY